MAKLDGASRAFIVMSRDGSLGIRWNVSTSVAMRGDAALLRIAREKHPLGRFFVDDMSDFALDQRYDAIVCLFSSIAYLITQERVQRALTCFCHHLRRGGVLLVEPWFSPGALSAGRAFRHSGTYRGMCVERVSHTEIDGRISRLHFDYRIEAPDGVRHATEIHELGLFTPDEMQTAFEHAGLRAEFDSVGITGRGLWIATV
jgi:dTDP-3-amino-3,4,6-trideoxy-alpha-D-glucopyranose N,N-dimethyltransferase